MVAALILSGAHAHFRPSITQFAIAHFQTEPEDILFSRSIDETAMDTRERWESGRYRFVMREIIETKLEQILHATHRKPQYTGIVVAKVRRSECSPEFPTSAEFARKQHEVIAKWGLFHELRLACFTPDRKIVEIET
ncbi:hypothetical protein BH11PAT2_BH11PAT2_09310 [soil metagenome]